MCVRVGCAVSFGEAVVCVVMLPIHPILSTLMEVVFKYECKNEI